MNDFSQKVVGRILSDRKLSQLVVLTIVTFLLFSLLKPDLFFTRRNLQSMAFQIPEVAILSMAVMLSMLTGGIDLSIVSISSLSALTSAFLMVNHTKTGASNVDAWILIACLAGMFVGFLGGCVNSWLIAKVNVTPILATLATLTLFNGLAVGITNGESITGLPDEFQRIGNGTFYGVPTPFIVMVVAAIFVAIYINRTGLGLKTFLVGANRTASRYSVVGDRRVIAITYLLSSLLASLAGLVITARSASANPDYGSSYILLAIVVVVLGGVSPFGGFGTVTGVLLGTFVLQMVSSGFNALRFSQFFYLISQGGVLIMIMIVNVLMERKSLARAKRKSQKEITV